MLIGLDRLDCSYVLAASFCDGLELHGTHHLRNLSIFPRQRSLEVSSSRRSPGSAIVLGCSVSVAALQRQMSAVRMSLEQ